MWVRDLPVRLRGRRLGSCSNRLRSRRWHLLKCKLRARRALMCTRGPKGSRRCSSVGLRRPRRCSRRMRRARRTRNRRPKASRLKYRARLLLISMYVPMVRPIPQKRAPLPRQPRHQACSGFRWAMGVSKPVQALLLQMATRARPTLPRRAAIKRLLALLPRAVKQVVRGVQ